MNLWFASTVKPCIYIDTINNIHFHASGLAAQEGSFPLAPQLTIGQMNYEFSDLPPKASEISSGWQQDIKLDEPTAACRTANLTFLDG